MFLQMSETGDTEPSNTKELFPELRHDSFIELEETSDINDDRRPTTPFSIRYDLKIVFTNYIFNRVVIFFNLNVSIIFGLFLAICFPKQAMLTTWSLQIAM